jgi:hypothetical protein
MGDGWDMNKSEEYRHNAASCRRVAEQTDGPAEKASLREMARAWHNLADQAERNSKADLVYETPTPRPGPQQPVVQQQQQIQPGKDEPES